MRLSFRYRSRFINTVVSVTFRIWLPENEANVVAVCLERIQAGLVPYSAHWLLERIADLEKIQVDDADVNREIEALAKQSKQTSEAVRARLTEDGGLDRIRMRIRSEKTLDFIYHQSA